MSPQHSRSNLRQKQLRTWQRKHGKGRMGGETLQVLEGQKMPKGPTFNKPLRPLDKHHNLGVNPVNPIIKVFPRKWGFDQEVDLEALEPQASQTRLPHLLLKQGTARLDIVDMSSLPFHPHTLQADRRHLAVLRELTRGETWPTDYSICYSIQYKIWNLKIQENQHHQPMHLKANAKRARMVGTGPCLGVFYQISPSDMWSPDICRWKVDLRQSWSSPLSHKATWT